MNVLLQELNRLRSAALSLGFYELLEATAKLLERECTMLPSTAHPDAALQMTHAANSLRHSELARDASRLILPLQTNFAATGGNSWCSCGRRRLARWSVICPQLPCIANYQSVSQSVENRFIQYRKLLAIFLVGASPRALSPAGDGTVLSKHTALTEVLTTPKAVAR